MSTPTPFAVLFFSTHPDLNNDDCTTGFDFSTEAEARVLLADPAKWVAANAPAWVKYRLVEEHQTLVLDGPDVHEVIPNPQYKPSPVVDDDDEWRREIAMEAGMLHGVNAYNEAMGYDEGES